MDDLRAELIRYVTMVLAHRWLAVGLAWLICVAGWAGVTSIPNKYESNARVYIDADAVLTPLLRGLALDNSVASQIEVLQRTLLSRPNLEKLVSKTDLSLQIGTPADLERMIGGLRSQIAVVPQTNDLFTITYRNSDPHLAYDVVRTILGIFIEDKAGSSRSDMSNARVFLDQQIAGYERQLREAEARRAAFRAKYLDLIPDADSGTSRLDDARAELRKLTGQLADAKARRDVLKEELGTTSPTLVTESGGGPGGSGALELAEAKLREMRLSLTDENPDVVRQRALVGSLRHGGGGGSGPVVRGHSEPNMLYQQLKVLLVQADSDVSSLSRQVEDAQSESSRLEQIARDVPTVQAQSINLTRDYDVLRKNYEDLLGRRESMRLSNAADTEADKVKIEVIDPPQIPLIPVSPQRPFLLSLVLLAGVGGGLGGAILLGKLDRSFHSVGDLRALGFAVAGSVSLLAAKIEKRRFSRSGLVAASVAFLLLAVAYGGLVYRALNEAGHA